MVTQAEREAARKLFSSAAGQKSLTVADASDVAAASKVEGQAEADLNASAAAETAQADGLVGI